MVALWVINQKDQTNSSSIPTDKSMPPYHWNTLQSTTWEISRDQPEKQNTLQTTTWHYNETTQLSQFTQPIITLTTPTTVTIIRSQTGKTVNNEAIQLSGDVKITQYPIIDNPLLSPAAPSTLNTQNLTYNASQAELLSRDTITLTQTGSVTTGIGLHANLETGQFQLMSNVQSTYQPNKSNTPSTP
jgi:LPS export ABC transporter protein LptC